LRQLKKDSEDISFDEGNEEYKVIQQFVKHYSNGSTGGYIRQRPNAIKLLVKFFFNYKKAIKSKELRPLEYALCCLDIYKHTDKLIHAEYINKWMEKYLTKLDSTSNLDDVQLMFASDSLILEVFVMPNPLFTVDLNNYIKRFGPKRNG